VWGTMNKLHLNKSLSRLAVACALSVYALSAIAGSPVTPPTTGTVREPFKKPELKAPRDEAPPPVQQKSAPRPRSDDQRKITVNRFEISGNAAFTTEQLLAPIKELQGQKLTLDEIYAAADILTDFYKTRGFSLAKVVVPAQRISLGVIQLEVIEGRLNAINFEGNESYDGDFLRDYFSSVQAGQAVTLDSLERELLLLNDLPGLTSRAVVRPGPVYGTSDLLIKSEEKPFQGRVSVNNYGRIGVGEWRVEAELIANNLIGVGDQFTVAITQSESDALTYANFAYSTPVNKRGTRIGANFSYIDFKVIDDQFRGLDIEGENRDYQITLSHPLQRSRRQNILLGLGYGRNDSESDNVFGSFSNNDIKLLDISVLYNKVHDNNATSSVSAVYSTNFRSNPDGQTNNAQRGKLVIDANHLYPISRNWNLFFRGIVSLSADPLADSEQFSVGGQGSVRGFQSAEVRGDEGFAVTTEIRRRFNLENELPGSFRAFFDTGRIRNIEPSAGVDKEETLTSLGFGVTVVPARNFSLDLEYARPIDASATDDGRDGGRVWFNATVLF